MAREYDLLIPGPDSRTGTANVHTLTPDAFEALQTLVLERGEMALGPVATLTRLGRDPALKLSQWVGVIRLPGGTTVEILPKTHERPGERHHEGSLERSRATLLCMLSATDERFRVAPPAELDTAHMPLLEVVLRYALESIRTALRRGVPHAYVPVQEERPGLRGRLDLPRQVRQWPQRAHLLHVTYDEFLPDRPETRLVRLAVARVGQLSRVGATRRLARELLYALDGIPPSSNVPADFQAWRLERGHVHFAPLLPVCRMILLELNPLVSGQSATAHALLFDMNRVYESYVAHLIRTAHPDWQVETQVTEHALGWAGGQAAFKLRPDLRLTLPGGQVIIADTKWKRLDAQDAPTYGVSNADAYQMLAYSDVFQDDAQRRHLYLIYPQLSARLGQPPPIELPKGRVLHIVAVDLDQPAFTLQDDLAISPPP